MNRRSFLSAGAAGVAAAGPAAALQDTSRRATELRVGACQILTSPQPKRSVEKICSWLEKASKEKLDVVLFPEAAICGYSCEPDYWKTANRSDFESAEETVVSTARKLDIAVVLGTAHWEDGAVFNSVLIIDKGGRIRGRYSKTHLAEAWSTPGRTLPIWTVAGVKSCFIICHDIRYPELVRLPAIAGAQICYYSGNAGPLVDEHKLSAYRAMPIARATENSIYLVMANAPADSRNMHAQSQSHGNSKVIHPNGTVLTEAGYFAETLVSATIDLRAADRAIAKRAVNDKTILSKWLQEGSRLVDGEVS